MASTKRIRTATTSTKEDDKDDEKQQGWRWTATETEFTEAARLWTSIIAEGGSHAAVWLCPSWGEMNFAVRVNEDEERRTESRNE